MEPEEALKALCERQRCEFGADREHLVQYDAVPALVTHVEAVLSKLGAREKGVAEMMQDIRSCADFMERHSYGRWRSLLLNIEQSITAPETYRRLP